MGEKETIDIFVQTTRYARFLLDEPLSRIALSARKNDRERPDFKNVIEECEDLMVSIKCLLRKLEAPSGSVVGVASVAKKEPCTSRSNSPRPAFTRSLSLMSLPNSSVKGRGAEIGLKQKTSSVRGYMRERNFNFKPSNLKKMNGEIKNEVYIFQDEKVDINSTFVSLCKKLDSKELTCGYYCRPCFTLCPNEKEWVEHCNSKSHSFIFFKKIKNILSSCNKCSVKVIGSKLLATSYIRYHIQENHPEVRKSEYFHFYELENIEQSQCQGDKEYRPPPLRPARYPLKNAKAPTTKVPARKIQPNPMPDADALEQILLDVIEKKKKSIEPGHQPFHGICVICREVKEDVFEFVQHQTIHGNKLETSDCDTCNLSLCGYGDAVQRLFNHPAHDEVDKYAL